MEYFELDIDLVLAVYTARTVQTVLFGFIS